MTSLPHMKDKLPHIMTKLPYIMSNAPYIMLKQLHIMIELSHIMNKSPYIMTKLLHVMTKVPHITMEAPHIVTTNHLRQSWHSILLNSKCHLFGKLGKKQEYISETALAISDLPQYSYQCLKDKDVIGEGGFAVVFTAKLPENGKQIVVKKLLATNNEAKKSLVKEARLLSKLQHPDVVEFKGVCLDIYAVLLEYIHLNFAPIGQNTSVHSVHSLAGFLSVCQLSNCEGMHNSVFFHAALYVASGLTWPEMTDIINILLYP